MSGSTSIQELNRLPLAAFRELFAALGPVAVAEMHGRFHSQFVGPAWLRQTAPAALTLGGLGGWCGKVFDGQGGGQNLVRRRGDVRQVMPVVLQERPSLVDHHPTLTIVYPHTSPFPWPFIVDEVRRLNDQTLLGLTLITRFGLSRWAFPFLLHQAD